LAWLNTASNLVAPETRLKSASPDRLAYDLRLIMLRYQRDGAAATAAQVERPTSLLGRQPWSRRDFAKACAAAWTKE
jgi:hypothetical protein